ncbi:MAG: hypothetical protein M0Z31_14375 [Clostridia bacterium]|nr:hypothetical protein [Clostridia bacterium]
MSSSSGNFAEDLIVALETEGGKAFAERLESLILTIQKHCQETEEGAKEPVPCPFCGQATTQYFCSPNLHVHLHCEHCEALLGM